MFDRGESSPHPHGARLADGGLFAWRGGEVVLLAQRSEGRWVVARGWREGDRLAHVRRWSFADPRGLAGQVRRLTLEASGAAAGSARSCGDALAWAASDGGRMPSPEPTPQL